MDRVVIHLQRCDVAAIGSVPENGVLIGGAGDDFAVRRPGDAVDGSRPCSTVRSCLNCTVSQNVAKPLVPPATTSALPSGDHATFEVKPLWFFKMRTVMPVFAFQMRAVLSKLPSTRAIEPSGENATPYTEELWPTKARTSLPVAASQTRTTPS